MTFWADGLTGSSGDVLCGLDTPTALLGLQRPHLHYEAQIKNCPVLKIPHSWEESEGRSTVGGPCSACMLT